jgi:dTDP-D-glucose 4,6-dehydratase
MSEQIEQPLQSNSPVIVLDPGTPQLDELTFEQQIEKLLMKCSAEELTYIERAIKEEQEYRRFSEIKVQQIKNKLKQIESEFDKKMKAKKQLLATKFIDGDVLVESSEEPNDEMPATKKKIKAPSKTVKKSSKR